MFSPAVFLLLLGCDKTVAKALFHHWFPGRHPLLCSGNHTPLLTGHTPDKLEGKYTEVGLSSFLCCLSFACPERTPLAATRKGLNLLTCSLCKTIASQYLPLVNQQVWLQLLQAAGFYTSMVFFLAFFRRQIKVYFPLHTYTESSSGIIKYTLLDSHVMMLFQLISVSKKPAQWIWSQCESSIGVGLYLEQ